MPPVWTDLATAAVLVLGPGGAAPTSYPGYYPQDAAPRAPASRHFPSGSAVKAPGLAWGAGVSRIPGFFRYFFQRRRAGASQNAVHAGLGNYLPGGGEIPLDPGTRKGL